MKIIRKKDNCSIAREYIGGYEGSAMSMWGVFTNTKGTKKQKHAAVYKKFKKYFDSLPKGKQTTL